MIDRRKFILGAASLFCAPAIVKAENIMRVAPLVLPEASRILTPEEIIREELRILHEKCALSLPNNGMPGRIGGFDPVVFRRPAPYRRGNGRKGVQI